MAYSKVDDMKTYVTINIHCNCDGCQDIWKGYGKILGVESVRVDDEGKKVIILIIGDSKKLEAKLKEQKKMYSTNSDPKKRIEKLKKQEKVFSKKRIEEINEQEKVFSKKRIEELKELNEQKKVFKLVDRTFQKMQIVLHQQPALEIDKSIVKNSQGCCGKHCYELEKNKQFTCDGCKEKGCGSRYKCKHCGSVLHKECMFHKHSISPEIFSGYTFEFRRRLPSSAKPRSCDACGNHIKGYFYACDARNLALHPCCSNLKEKLHSGGMDFILHKKVSSSSKCKCCKQKTPFGTKTRNPGCSYVSKCNEYHFHVYCITQMVHEAWTNGDIAGSTDDFAMALEKMDLKPVETKNRNGGSGGNNIWTTISIFISTIAACLLGNPTAVLVPLFLGFFIKSIPKLLPKLD